MGLNDIIEELEQNHSVIGSFKIEDVEFSDFGPDFIIESIHSKLILKKASTSGSMNEAFKKQKQPITITPNRIDILFRNTTPKGIEGLPCAVFLIPDKNLMRYPIDKRPIGEIYNKNVLYVESVFKKHGYNTERAQITKEDYFKDYNHFPHTFPICR